MMQVVSIYPDQNDTGHNTQAYNAYSEVKRIDPAAFAKVARGEQHGDFGSLAAFANAIGNYNPEAVTVNQLKDKAIKYLSDVIDDTDRMPAYRHPYSDSLDANPVYDGVSANSFRNQQSGHLYIPEGYNQPAQQVRKATDEDVERLRGSMDEYTNKLTPRQMAFWERLSAVSREQAKGNPLPINSNQVLVKYESVQPEQSVYFDPAKSINLMVPDANSDSLYY